MGFGPVTIALPRVKADGARLAVQPEGSELRVETAGAGIRFTVPPFGVHQVVTVG